MKISVSELIYLNEAAKSLKQKNFILFNNMIIGLDNIQNMFIYSVLDNNFINYYNGMIINQRELSAFIKTLSVESDFEIINGKINSMRGDELNIIFDSNMLTMVINAYNKIINIEQTKPLHMIQEQLVDDISSKIKSMSRSDGSINIIYENYYMVLFPTIFPINKADKLFLTIIKLDINSFISKFRIQKKKFNIIMYIHYLDIRMR